jgi:hypothetical protein
LRFVGDGPSIPDDLLQARDQGRVIFFCGAGVSRARANLPSFFGLAEKVIAVLGVTENSAAFKLVHEAQAIDQRVGVAGVISADRIFGLLERDFLSRDIEAAVASSLKPEGNCDLSAHQILLDLATTADGVVRLVTTNFDRLFDGCGRNLTVWQPPRLPDPARPAEMQGLIYLHGRVTPQYDSAEADGFVLSSSEFGRAYLADGWATRFVREIIQRYVVVFIGYTADDPPVQYLLEALHKTTDKSERVYAFQSGGPDDAAARWRHKGVQAIAYDPSSNHVALWDTLNAWAIRARDPDRWYSDVIKAAEKGPATLAPHERGQVAHIVSTYEGMKKFAEGDNPPPAEWLCVFDPYRRFAKPAHLGNFRNRGPYVDPFELYGIDSDVVPNKIDPDDHYASREVPKDAWDAFALNRLDQSASREDQFAALRGPLAVSSPRLGPRLRQLGLWIANTSDQPAGVWWAAHQVGLHENIRTQIRWRLERTDRDSRPEIRRAWRYLFEAWEESDPFEREDFVLRALVAKDGWDSTTVRRFAEARRPRLEVQANFWGQPRPPEVSAEIEIHDLVRRDVKYPEHVETIDVPDVWVAATTKALRWNLELALVLEREVGGYGLANISPIAPDDREDESRYDRTHGLSAAVLEYSRFFDRLVAVDSKVALAEMNAWPVDDDTIFTKLRIWAAGFPDLILSECLCDVLGTLSNEGFWDGGHQRDLLIVLNKRWNDLPDKSLRAIEQRLLAGPPQWKGEDDNSFQVRRAWTILSRIHWLAKNGSHFTFNLQEVTESLASIASEWKFEYAEKAAESRESRSGFVKTITDDNLLLNIPLSLILTRAKELSGRTSDFLVKTDPYAGLSATHPLRAISALTFAGRHGEVPEWAWETFLNSDARKNDKPRFVAFVAERMAAYPERSIAPIVRASSDWLLKVGKVLATNFPATFEKIISKLITVLHLNPDKGRSAIIRGRYQEPDWTMEAINGPAGKLAQNLFEDPRLNCLKSDEGIPMVWIGLAERLLNLPEDMRRHAVVIFFHNLNWFYAHHPIWTEGNLLSVFESDDAEDGKAAWAGFLWGAKIPNKGLYIRLKPSLLAFVTNRRQSRRGYGQILAGVILAGWIRIDEENGESWISSAELRQLLLEADDEFRSQILWQAERWSSADDPNEKEKWGARLTELLRNVWPRQVAVKSPAISARLCELAFSDKDRFPQIAEAVLPLLSQFDRAQHLGLSKLTMSSSEIVAVYPRQTLALIAAVLPDDAATWPYGVETILRRIGEADPSLVDDARLVGLQRRWDAR